MYSAHRANPNSVSWAMALDHRTLDEPPLRVESVMSSEVVTCVASDSLSTAAQIMWDRDCGCVPVLDGAAHVVGMITDRDICMGAYTQGKPLHEIAVGSACSRQVFSCHRRDLVSDVTRMMAGAQVRRVPVLDVDEKLVGILTLSDLVRHIWFARPTSPGPERGQRMAALLEAISRPGSVPPDDLVALTKDPSCRVRHTLIRWTT
jgi:CBS domain-containing protein